MKRKIKITTQDKGFALILTVSMLVLMAIVVTGLLTLSATSLRSTNQRNAELEARANARMALGIALGQLQKYAGPDQRVTATADLVYSDAELDSVNNLSAKWTGVWSSKSRPDSSGLLQGDGSDPAPLDSGKPVWLVSGFDSNSSSTKTTDSPKQVPADPDDRIELVSELKVGNNTYREPVVVPLEKVFENGDGSQNETGAYGYWVSDDGVKANISTVAKHNITEDQKRFQNPQHVDFGNVYKFDNRFSSTENADAASPTSASALQNLPSKNSIGLIAKGPQENFARWFHDVTTDSVGLLTDVKSGGLKINLSTGLRSSRLTELIDDYNDHNLALREQQNDFDTNVNYNGNRQLFLSADAGLERRFDAGRAALYDEGGPTWDQIASFAITQDNNDTISVSNPTNTEHGIAPIMTRFQYSYKTIAIPVRNIFDNGRLKNPSDFNRDDFLTRSQASNPSTLEAFLLRTFIFPAVTLWNPYDVPIQTGSLGLQFQIENFVFEDGDGDPVKTLNNSVTPSTDLSNESRNRQDHYLDFGITDASGKRIFNDPNEPATMNYVKFRLFNTRMEPGETVNFIIPENVPYASNTEANNLLVPGGAPLLTNGVFFHGMNNGSSIDPSTGNKLTSSLIYADDISGNLNQQIQELERITYTMDRNMFPFNYSLFENITNNTNGNDDFDQLSNRITTIATTGFWAESGGTVRDQPKDTVKVLFSDRINNNGRAEELIPPMENAPIDYVNFDPSSPPPVVNTSGNPFIYSTSTAPSVKGPREGIFSVLMMPGTPGLRYNQATFPNWHNQGNGGDRRYVVPWLGQFNPRSVRSIRVPHGGTRGSQNGIFNGNPLYLGQHVSNNDNNILNIYTQGLERDRGYVGYSIEGGAAGNNPSESVLFHYPRAGQPITSVGDLMHGNFHYVSPAAMVTDWGNTFNIAHAAPAYAIGNSLSSMFLPLNEFKMNWNDREATPSGKFPGWGPGNVLGAHYDYSYLLNNALWDRYFFAPVSTTSLPNFESSFLDNARYLPINQARVGTSSFANNLNNPFKFSEEIQLDGAFNINSTSVAAWEAILSSYRGQNAGNFSTLQRNYSSISRFAHTQNNTRTSNDADSFSDSLNDSSKYNGHLRLSDQQVRQIARGIVQFMKERRNRSANGDNNYPYLSLAEFINRSINEADTNNVNREQYAYSGVIQQAIDNSNSISGNLTERVNESYFADRTQAKFTRSKPYYFDSSLRAAEQQSIFSNLPGYFTQADLLARFGSIFTARSDTFTIRAYGDSRDSSGNISAIAYCEAKVQRTIDYVDPDDSADTKTSQLTKVVNRRLGRRFKLTSFRWVPKSEI